MSFLSDSQGIEEYLFSIALPVTSLNCSCHLQVLRSIKEVVSLYIDNEYNLSILP